MDHGDDRPETGWLLGSADPEGEQPAARDAEAEPGPETPAKRRRGFIRRHKLLSALIGLLTLVVVVVLVSTLLVNRELGNIDRVPLTITGKRPPPPNDGSMNILLAGIDNGGKVYDSHPISEMLKDGKWVPGSHHTDAIMVLHLTADRKHAYLVSIPRDTYVRVDGHGMQKINTALDFGGPSLFVRTLEQFTGLRMRHLAIVDFNGFRDLSTALGGVRVYVPFNSNDRAHHHRWRQGWHVLTGDEALLYVRQRHGLPNADFDRMKRQQNFIRAALAEMVSRGTLSNPVKLGRTLHAITSNLTLDSDFTNAEVRGLAWSLRHLRADDITFISSPTAGYGSEKVGTVVYSRVDQTRELFRDVATDNLDSFLQKYPGQGILRDPTDVN